MRGTCNNHSYFLTICHHQLHRRHDHHDHHKFIIILMIKIWPQHCVFFLLGQCGFSSVAEVCQAPSLDSDQGSSFSLWWWWWQCLLTMMTMMIMTIVMIVSNSNVSDSFAQFWSSWSLWLSARNIGKNWWSQLVGLLICKPKGRLFESKFCARGLHTQIIFLLLVH